MHGPVGAGKSAIMRTTAQRLDEAGILLASFFFFRSEIRRNTSIPFIPTLSLQTSLHIPQSKTYIAHSVRENPTIFSQASHLQCADLLQTPLINLLTSPDAQCGWSSTSPRVIIVDGLDECMDSGGQEEIIRALDQLPSVLRTRTACRVKILVASRPELRIKTEFERLRSSNKATVIGLDSSDAELHLFYAQRFTEIREKYPDLEHWPSVEDLEWLMDKTSGQYSFADVSTRHLAGGDPVHRLRVIRQAFIDFKRDGNPFEPLDFLYATVFKQLPSEMLRPALLILRLRLGREPRWVDSYASILEPFFQLPQGFLSRLASHLSSLINFDDNLRPYHASLADFLLDPQRSASFGLGIDEALFRRTILRGTFAPVAVPVGSHRRRLGAEEKDIFTHLVTGTYYPTPGQPRIHCADTMQEVVALLNEVDLSRLDLWAFFYFYRLCEAIRSGRLHVQPQPPPSFGSRLWYMVTHSLPRQMKCVWLDKIASYGRGHGFINVAEFAMGVSFLCLARNGPSRNGSVYGMQFGFREVAKRIFRLLRNAIQASGQLSIIDATQGWELSNLVDYITCDSEVTNSGDLIWDGIHRFQGAKHRSKCVQIVLYQILRSSTTSERTRPFVAELAVCGTKDCTEASLPAVAQCVTCVDTLHTLGCEGDCSS